MIMDHSLRDVTVQTFIDTLRDATARLDVVHPEALREPLALWFRATEVQVIDDGWGHLLGRSVVSVWNAARAVLDEPQGEAGDSDQATAIGAGNLSRGLVTPPILLLSPAELGAMVTQSLKDPGKRHSEAHVWPPSSVFRDDNGDW